jgi:hypothetical protein
MNLERFNVFVADYLEEYVAKTGDWEGADAIGERIRKEIHDLINSGMSEYDLFSD